MDCRESSLDHLRQFPEAEQRQAGDEPRKPQRRKARVRGLGVRPKEAKRLLGLADARGDQSILLKRQPSTRSPNGMKEPSVTQATGAEVLHVTRPLVSDVVNHKVENFTIDALVSILARIGKHVHLAVQ